MRPRATPPAVRSRPASPSPWPKASRTAHARHERRIEVIRLASPRGEICVLPQVRPGLRTPFVASVRDELCRRPCASSPRADSATSRLLTPPADAFFAGAVLARALSAPLKALVDGARLRPAYHVLQPSGGRSRQPRALCRCSGGVLTDGEGRSGGGRERSGAAAARPASARLPPSSRPSARRRFRPASLERLLPARRDSALRSPHPSRRLGHGRDPRGGRQGGAQGVRPVPPLRLLKTR